MRFKRKHPMNVTLAGIEELDLFPDQAAREAAIKSHADSIKGWSLLLGIGLCTAVALTALVVARFAMIPAISRALPSGLPLWSRDPLQWAIVMTAMFFCVRGLHRWGVRRELRRRLIDLRVPVCLGCGYLLRGLPATSERCPECGRAVDQTIRRLLQESADSMTAAHEEFNGAKGR